ncbi:hypothetical protein [Poriferisphaera sp. WC338]|uniref:hypothetical protein n=1 Tax=Poriferisphaera sp. WC338 TaxID=3425129 RepID=UPI003D81BF18
MSRPKLQSRRQMLEQFIGSVIPGGKIDHDQPTAESTAVANMQTTKPIEDEQVGDTSSTQVIGLPELQDQLLDMQTVDCLFSDIGQCATFLSAVPRYMSRSFVDPSPVGLDEARLLVLQRQARAVQLRYVFEGMEWWDTLMPQDEGVRLVRIAHKDGVPLSQ